MSTSLEYITERICERNALHGKKLVSNLQKFDKDYFKRAELFFGKYESLLHKNSKTMDYAIDCYLQMLADVQYESVQFIQTGAYSSQSFAEVNQRVYGNPEIMEYYMHGLLLSQFLWTHHYNILLFFNEIISKYSAQIHHYLEVGGGHGLYISEAISIIGNSAQFDMVDISQSSLDMASQMIGSDNINSYLSDIHDFHPENCYDFITMGEVMEHVEDPLELLRKTYSLLKETGRLFITTPTNAPAIDHIYLFKHADDIRSIITSAGFEIENELSIYSEDMPVEKAEKLKVSMMYAAVLKKKSNL